MRGVAAPGRPDPLRRATSVSEVASRSRGARSGVVIRLVGLLVSIAALGLVIRSVDLGACATVISHANPIPLAACMVVIATQVVLRSLRWLKINPPNPLTVHLGICMLLNLHLVSQSHF